MDEQIINNIEKRLNELESLNKKLMKIVDQVTLPLKTAYRVLMWYGLADGTALTQSFDIQEIRGKTIIIKAFRLFNYYNNDPSVDIWMNDGAGSQFVEVIQSGYRVNRLFDRWGSGTQVGMLINGMPSALFAEDAGVSHFPGDMELDNIFYEVPEKIQTWDMTVFTEILEDLQTPTTDNPLVKVMVECYIK